MKSLGKKTPAFDNVHVCVRPRVRVGGGGVTFHLQGSRVQCQAASLTESFCVRVPGGEAPVWNTNAHGREEAPGHVRAIAIAIAIALGLAATREPSGRPSSAAMMNGPKLRPN